MKKLTVILPAAVLILAGACRKEKIMTWSGDDRIRFRTDLASDTLQSYSFLGQTDEVTSHIMYIEVDAEGGVRDFPRTVTLRQVATGGGDAVAGTHYVAFDDAQVKGRYVIAAGEASVEIPVVLLRHPSLLDQEKTLRVELVGNEFFGLTTDNNRRFRVITFAEKPAMPDAWNTAVMSASNTVPYFGAYGPAKHRFMIDQTNTTFDNDWFSAYFTFEATGTWMIPRDTGYVSYIRQLLQRKLDALNAAAGEGKELKEADGTIVRFI
jgi:hypothetical protein